MLNLGISEDSFYISSRAASIISRKYMDTENPALLKGARKAISQSDLVIFGGAPLFNYDYQRFYLRTIKTIEIANEFDVPVLFSSIGVEPFDPGNSKCLQLKEALALPCVRQLTTRDDLASAEKYVQGTHIPVSHVSDPAVFADVVFDKVLSSSSSRESNGKKRIGLVPTRVGLFQDSKINFTESDQRSFWMDVIQLLQGRGYDYKVFTTGHFSDEVFLDSLVREGIVPRTKAEVTVNSPEELMAELQECDGVIAFRLHASITSFALRVPSVGLSWNFKVPYFYDSVGYRERAFAPAEWKADLVVDGLEKAMNEGVQPDEEFLMTVYNSLFHGIKQTIAPESKAEPYSYSALCGALPRYEGTTMEAYRLKVRGKLRRTYDSYPSMVVRDDQGSVRPKKQMPSLTKLLKRGFRSAKSKVGKTYRRFTRVTRG